jgi:ATP-binding cassette subfamily F protein uup
VNYLSVENLSKHYGELVLFENISFGLSKGDKVALIAKNGTGKTSLIKILSGLDSPDEGRFVFRNGINFAYLPQQPEFEGDISIEELLRSTHSRTLEIIREYENAIDAQTEDYNEQTQKAVDECSAQMDFYDAWDYEDRVKQMLSRFKIVNIKQKINTLSGGQKKRLALAFTLLDKPDILFLDEPTNHLDIGMIEWLENYLTTSSTTLLMVTHDRYFLDKVCNNILELSRGNIHLHKGNYSYFLEKKALREANEQMSIEHAKKYVKSELDWMRRMPRARTTKSKARIDSFYETEDHAKSGVREKNLKIEIQTKRVGGKILELEKVNKSFGENVMVKDLSYLFKKGEKIGIIGPNGVGKSTLLNIITGSLKPDSGTVVKGETINYGYYSQEGLTFDKNKKVIEILTDIAEIVKVGKNQTITASQFLTFFLFEPKVQNNYVYTLSGGELRRLYLLTVLIKNPNFLILDEPTNDLDIETLNILEEFLVDFQGCVLLVSHDRYLMDRLVDHIFLFEGEGKIRDFYGNYTEYRLEKEDNIKKQRAIQSELKKQEQKENKKLVKGKPKTKLSYNETNEHKQLEKDIALLEKEKSEQEVLLNSGIQDYEKLEKTAARIGEIMEILDEKTLRWMELEEYL